MRRTERRDPRSPHHAELTRSSRRIEHQQLRADHDLIEAVRAGQVDDQHPDPIARLLAHWRDHTFAGT
jgi:hypothetical protein